MSDPRNSTSQIHFMNEGSQIILPGSNTAATITVRRIDGHRVTLIFDAQVEESHPEVGLGRTYRSRQEYDLDLSQPVSIGRNSNSVLRVPENNGNMQVSGNQGFLRIKDGTLCFENIGRNRVGWVQLGPAVLRSQYPTSDEIRADEQRRQAEAERMAKVNRDRQREAMLNDPQVDGVITRKDSDEAPARKQIQTGSRLVMPTAQGKSPVSIIVLKIVGNAVTFVTEHEGKVSNPITYNLDKPISIGRDPSSDLTLSEFPQISKNQGLFGLENGTLFYEHHGRNPVEYFSTPSIQDVGPRATVVETLQSRDSNPNDSVRESAPGSRNEIPVLRQEVNTSNRSSAIHDLMLRQKKLMDVQAQLQASIAANDSRSSQQQPQQQQQAKASQRSAARSIPSGEYEGEERTPEELARDKALSEAVDARDRALLDLDYMQPVDFERQRSEAELAAARQKINDEYQAKWLKINDEFQSERQKINDEFQSERQKINAEFEAERAKPVAEGSRSNGATANESPDNSGRAQAEADGRAGRAFAIAGLGTRAEDIRKNGYISTDGAAMALDVTGLMNNNVGNSAGLAGNLVGALSGGYKAYEQAKQEGKSDDEALQAGAIQTGKGAMGSVVMAETLATGSTAQTVKSTVAIAKQIPDAVKALKSGQTYKDAAIAIKETVVATKNTVVAGATVKNVKDTVNVANAIKTGKAGLDLLKGAGKMSGQMGLANSAITGASELIDYATGAKEDNYDNRTASATKTVLALDPLKAITGLANVTKLVGVDTGIQDISMSSLADRVIGSGKGEYLDKQIDEINKIYDEESKRFKAAEVSKEFRRVDEAGKLTLKDGSVMERPLMTDYKHLAAIRQRMVKVYEEKTGKPFEIDGKNVSLEFDKIDMSKPENYMAYRKAMNIYMNEQMRIMEENSSYVPRWLRSGDSAEKYNAAESEVKILKAAEEEFRQFESRSLQYASTKNELEGSAEREAQRAQQETQAKLAELEQKRAEAIATVRVQQEARELVAEEARTREEKAKDSSGEFITSNTSEPIAEDKKAIDPSLRNSASNNVTQVASTSQRLLPRLSNDEFASLGLDDMTKEDIRSILESANKGDYSAIRELLQENTKFAEAVQRRMPEVVIGSRNNGVLELVKPVWINPDLIPKDIDPNLKDSPELRKKDDLVTPIGLDEESINKLVKQFTEKKAQMVLLSSDSVTPSSLGELSPQNIGKKAKPEGPKLS